MKLDKDTFVAWVHPSFRDVVIDDLMRSPADRRAFLKACDPTGLQLALSSAGGIDGERRRPLLQDEADWDVVARRVSDLIRPGGFAVGRDLLSALEAALVDDDGPDVQRLAATALDATLERWATAGGAISVEELEFFYRLTVRVAPLRPSPDLELTWRGVCGQLNSSKQLLSTDIRRLFRLMELLRANEPRFLVLHDPMPLLLSVVERARDVVKVMTAEAHELMEVVDDDADVGYDEISSHHSDLRLWTGLMSSPLLDLSTDDSSGPALTAAAKVVRDDLDHAYRRLGSWINGEEEGMAEAAWDREMEQGEQPDDEDEAMSLDDLVVAMFDDL